MALPAIVHVCRLGWRQWPIGLDRKRREWLQQRTGSWRRVVEWRVCDWCSRSFPVLHEYRRQRFCSKSCTGCYTQAQIPSEERVLRAKRSRVNQAAQAARGWEQLKARCRLYATEDDRLKAAYYLGYNAHKRAASMKRQQHPVLPGDRIAGAANSSPVVRSHR